MVEVKSLTANHSFLHYMIKMAQDLDNTLLKFLQDFQSLDKVARYDNMIYWFIAIFREKKNSIDLTD